MLVSIVVNNYNYDRYLTEAIDSALAQTYSPIEVLVVDDGSTDNSREIIASYGDRVTPLLKENGGQSSAFNYAYGHCNGDVIMFLDSDDCLYEGAVEALVEKMQDAKVSKCGGYLQVIDGDGNKVDQRIPRQLSPAGDYRQATLELGPASYTHCFTSGNAWARWFLDRIMPIPEDRRSIGADGYLTILDPLFGRVEVVDRIIGSYRVHGGNLGPIALRFTAKDLERKQGDMESRMVYLADWARKLDLEVDIDSWRRRDWRLMLKRYSLWLLDQTNTRPSFSELVLAPLRSDAPRLKAIASSLYLVLVWLAPQGISRELARRALGFLPA